MILLKVSDSRYLNMALLVDAQVVVKDGAVEAITLKFAAPSPASVAASDWTVKPHEVLLRGMAAQAVASWLEDRAGGIDL
jgi:hypothetical protein